MCMTSRVKLYNCFFFLSITRSTSIIAVVEVIVYLHEYEIYINVCLCIRLEIKDKALAILWNKEKNSRNCGHRSLVTSELQNFFKLLLYFEDKMALLLLLPRLLPSSFFYYYSRAPAMLTRQARYPSKKREKTRERYIYIYITSIESGEACPL